MDDGGPTASYILLILLLLADMIFYGFSAAVKELSAKELLEETAEVKSKKTVRLCKIMERPERYINTIQLVATFSNFVMAFIILYDFGKHFLLAGAIWLYIVLTFGVLIPKTLGTRYHKKWAYACINPIYGITWLLCPLTGIISVSAKGILRIFGVRPDEWQDDVTEEEIKSMVNEGHEQGVLQASEAEMINNIFEFGDKQAQDIMTHRPSILAIDREMTLGDALEYMLSESKSRFPVYEENIDHIVGIIHFRDAMRAHTDDNNLVLPVGEIQGLLREPMFVPETKNIDALFKMMQHTKTQMVIVVDEYGQTSGLVAMEDILEEIVGNILDEYDEVEEHIESTENADEYVIAGITPLSELEERFGISFQEEEFETLNGFLISKLDKIPEKSDENFTVEENGYQYRILSVENRMIQSVLVKKMPEKTAQEQQMQENLQEETQK